MSLQLHAYTVQQKLLIYLFPLFNSPRIFRAPFFKSVARMLVSLHKGLQTYPFMKFKERKFKEIRLEFRTQPTTFHGYTEKKLMKR
jgi:hypothetical protein